MNRKGARARINPILVEAQAAGFYRAFKLLRGQLWPPDLPPDTMRMAGGYGDLVPPMIVCLAFACELMLKTILAQHSVPAVDNRGRGEHNLQRLVNLLPTGEQACLKKQMGAQANNFDEHIAAHAQSFVTWRYVFEPPGEATADDDFLDALYQAARHCAHPL